MHLVATLFCHRHARANMMGTAGQPAEHLLGFSHVSRLTQRLLVQINQGVRSDDERIRSQDGSSAGFQKRVLGGELLGREGWIVRFLDVHGEHLKNESSLAHQLNTAR